MTSEEESKVESKDPIVEEKITNNHTGEEEEYEGRDWNKIVIAVVFVLIVVILWYVLSR